MIPMIKKMRYQFILVTMACIGLIFILILSVINISMTISSRNQGYHLLNRLADVQKAGKPSPENNREFSGHPAKKEEKIPPSAPVEGFDAFRSFSVLYDSADNIQDIFFQENSGLDSQTITALAEKIMAKSDPGIHGVSSKYLYLIRDTPAGKQIFFLDYSVEKNLSQRLFWTCLRIGLIGILFLFVAVIFLSRWIVRPVQTAFDKQKQFIADASHELKTPLTIITANAEVLAGNTGNNKWLENIFAQTGRMNTLIKNMLELARLDSYDQSQDSAFTDFNIGKTVKNAALSFESLAFEQGKTYSIDIDEALFFRGNENSIRELTTLLLDNAFKYSDEKGTVSICLTKHGDRKILTVENSGKGIPQADQQRIFERFYRSDTSRSSSLGGSGLGLSIAASIARIHKGHIAVKSDAASYTKMIVTLP